MRQSGFNLIGLMMTIGILAVLVGAIYVAVDPVTRIRAARDARRSQDIQILALALQDYVEENQGQLPLTGDVIFTKKALCTTGDSIACGGKKDTCLYVDSSTDFLSTYLAELPYDVDATYQGVSTGYYIRANENGKLIVGSCNYDNSPITYQTNIKVPVNCGTGALFDSRCWYKASAVAMSCDGVCAENGLTCTSGVTYSDPDCELNVALVPIPPSTCSFLCNDFAADYSPGNHVGVDVCLTTSASPAYVCSEAESSNYYKMLCACE